jgi:hypothetical protein
MSGYPQYARRAFYGYGRSCGRFHTDGNDENGNAELAR